MYSKKDSFLTLSSELDLFINKYYKHELVRGILLSSVFLVFLLGSAWFLEFLFRFSSFGRGVLLFGGALFALIYVSKLIISPLIKLFGLHGRMSHEEASILLSKKIPEIGDQLVNVIGLERQLEKTETDLLKASIERKALNSLRFDFRNSISITDQKKKFESIGWHVLEIDAHNEDEIDQALESAKLVTDKPSIIMAKSIIGKFAPNKQDTSGVHGSPLGSEEMEKFKESLQWEGDVFQHDAEVYDYFAEKRDKDNSQFSDWEKSFQAKYDNDEKFKKNWDLLTSNEVLLDFQSKNSSEATRIAGSNILSEIGKITNNIIGGSADLTASTKQIIGESTFSAADYSGRNIEYGIREHAMGAIVNGITLHSDLIGYGSTFLVFSDYMRPSIRLAALMETDSVYIFTHDSIYLGEDGPTHQPIEHLMALRLIPNLDVIRPSNSIEVEHAYRYAFTKSGNPKAIVLTRQNLEYLEFENSYQDFINGASIVSEGTEATIFASGSELELAFAAKEALKENSIRIVSTPILNKLENMSSETLSDLKVSDLNFTIELGRSVGWATYLGPITRSFSIDEFGTSAPIKNLQEEYKFTVENISSEIKKFLN